MLLHFSFQTSLVPFIWKHIRSRVHAIHKMLCYAFQFFLHISSTSRTVLFLLFYFILYFTNVIARFSLFFSNKNISTPVFHSWRGGYSNHTCYPTRKCALRKSKKWDSFHRIKLADLYQKGQIESSNTTEKKKQNNVVNGHLFSLPPAILWYRSISMTFNRIKIVFLFSNWNAKVRKTCYHSRGKSIAFIWALWHGKRFKPQGSCFVKPLVFWSNSSRNSVQSAQRTLKTQVIQLDVHIQTRNNNESKQMGFVCECETTVQ